MNTTSLRTAVRLVKVTLIGSAVVAIAACGVKPNGLDFTLDTPPLNTQTADPSWSIGTAQAFPGCRPIANLGDWTAPTRVVLSTRDGRVFAAPYTARVTRRVAASWLNETTADDVFTVGACK